VVFALHGAGNDALFGWIGFFKQLLTSDVEVFTFDLPGHGREDETRFDPAQLSTWLNTALDGCACSTTALPVHAVGVSLGGAVLLDALPRLQHRLASACLIVAPLHIHLSAGAVLTELGPGIRLLIREREHYGLTGLIPSFGPFKRSLYPLRLATDPAPGQFGYIDTLNEALAVLKLEEAARAVDLPVLLAYGDRDRVVPIEQGQKLSELIQGSELLRVAGGSHLSTPLDPSFVRRFLAWIEAWG
jgi:pimeloyl-ACP methyl ester carboxylesterase